MTIEPLHLSDVRAEEYATLRDQWVRYANDHALFALHAT